MKIYVEIVPAYWPEWSERPRSFRLGRLRKRRPHASELHHFAVVEFEPDPTTFQPKVQYPS